MFIERNIKLTLPSNIGNVWIIPKQWCCISKFLLFSTCTFIHFFIGLFSFSAKTLGNFGRNSFCIIISCGSFARFSLGQSLLRSNEYLWWVVLKQNHKCGITLHNTCNWQYWNCAMLCLQHYAITCTCTCISTLTFHFSSCFYSSSARNLKWCNFSSMFFRECAFLSDMRLVNHDQVNYGAMGRGFAACPFVAVISQQCSMCTVFHNHCEIKRLVHL